MRTVNTGKKEWVEGGREAGRDSQGRNLYIDDSVCNIK